jgi:hypothetical protein
MAVKKALKSLKSTLNRVVFAVLAVILAVYTTL